MNASTTGLESQPAENIRDVLCEPVWGGTYTPQIYREAVMRSNLNDVIAVILCIWDLDLVRGGIGIVISTGSNDLLLLRGPRTLLSGSKYETN